MDVAVADRPDSPPGDTGTQERVGADALWRVRCVEGDATCAGPSEPVSLLGFDGEGVSVDCNLLPVAGDQRSLSIDLAASPTEGLRIRDLLIASTGELAGNGVVQLTDGELELSGGGSGEAPTPALPCQFSPVQFIERTEGMAVRVEVLCRGIVSPASPANRRDVTHPENPMQPAIIEAFGCRGL